MNQFIRQIQAADDELIVGNVILYPTDTVWGIGCDAENAQAVRKIYKIKEREESKSMILLVADKQMLLRYVKQVPENFDELVAQQERPTTYVFSEPQNLPKEVLAEDGSVAIRITDDEFCHRLIRHSGRPLVSTSANISGEPSPKTYEDVSDVIKERVDYIVNWRRDDKMASQPSRIVKISPKGETTVLRD